MAQSDRLAQILLSPGRLDRFLLSPDQLARRARIPLSPDPQAQILLSLDQRAQILPSPDQQARRAQILLSPDQQAQILLFLDRLDQLAQILPSPDQLAQILLFLDRLDQLAQILPSLDRRGADSTVPGPIGPAGADSTVPGPAAPAATYERTSLGTATNASNTPTELTLSEDISSDALYELIITDSASAPTRSNGYALVTGARLLELAAQDSAPTTLGKSMAVKTTNPAVTALSDFSHDSFHLWRKDNTHLWWNSGRSYSTRLTVVKVVVGGAIGPAGADSTVPGPRGFTGSRGRQGPASTVPGPAGAAGTVLSDAFERDIAWTGVGGNDAILTDLTPPANCRMIYIAFRRDDIDGWTGGLYIDYAVWSAYTAVSAGTHINTNAWSFAALGIAFAANDDEWYVGKGTDGVLAVAAKRTDDAERRFDKICVRFVT